MNGRNVHVKGGPWKFGEAGCNSRAESGNDAEGSHVIFPSPPPPRDHANRVIFPARISRRGQAHVIVDNAIPRSRIVAARMKKVSTSDGAQSRLPGRLAERLSK